MKLGMRHFLVLLCLVAGLFLYFQKNDINSEWVTDRFFSAVYRPVGSMVSSVNDSIREKWQLYFDLVGVQAENLRLQNRMTQVEIENTLYKRKLKEANQLEFIQKNYAHLGKEILKARMIGYDIFPNSKTILVDRGSEHGVQVNDVILSRDGLVGRVLKVFTDRSQILLLSDPGFSVDAINQRTGFRMIVSGFNNQSLIGKRYPFLSRVEFIEGVYDMAPGDVLTTSGKGVVFPAGIPVGEVYREQEFVKKFQIDVESNDYWVVPYVDFTKLKDIYLLIGQKEKSES